MTALRADLPPLPDRMKSLPVDDRGYPVPYFVAWIDGKPDFRVVRPETAVHCWHYRLCWLCGQKLGRSMAFVIGPMCAINRVSSEPPSHLDCAEFAVKACPFLTRPRAKRRDAGLGELGTHKGPGIILERNPGVSLLWVSRDPSIMKVDGGYLYLVGEPISLKFFAEGREAMPGEIEESIRTGLPHLRKAAEEDGPEALRDLEHYLDRARRIMPRGVSL